VTTTEPSLSEGQSQAPEPGRHRTPAIGAWLPTWDLITTKNLEIRKRRGLMITMVVLIIVPTVLFYGLRLLFHAVDPHGYGLAGSPQFFSQSTNLIDEFGFIAAAALGAAAGTTDLSDGMFRHLVITGRSRLALYLARIPAGLAITVPLVALAFLMNCLVTSYESPPNPTTASFYGVTAPNNLDQAGLQTFMLAHPQQEINGFLPDMPGGPGTTATAAQVRSAIDQHIASYYSDYTTAELSESTPADNEMVKIGLCKALFMYCQQQQVDWITECIVYARKNGKQVVEATKEFEDNWVKHHDETAAATLVVKTDSWYMGSNVDGKTRRLLAYIGGVGNYNKQCDELAANGYQGFAMT